MERSFRTTTPLVVKVAGAASFIAALALSNWGAFAYDRYSVNKDATNCRACHGDFRASPYTSKVDGQSWGDDLHDVHRNTMLGGDCNTCHSGSGRFPVLLDTSNGGTGLAAISCTGCHGRSQDAGAGTQGAGAGLRQHHYRAGETICLNCHNDSNPANKTVVGENVKPPYYASPGTGHSIPTDPCNPPPSYTENFKGTTLGLDNDGDRVFDMTDTDCAPPSVCGNGQVEPGEQCDDGNTANGDCCSSTCQFESAGSPCSDGLFCTVGEACNGAGACSGATPRDCGDGIACTTDSCNEGAGLCVHTPSDAACGDGQFCNGVETCSVTQGCQPGAPVNCDDGDVCTDDSCNEAADACAHVFDPTNDPSCAALVCGNGTLDPGEQCDDGNTANGDCCSATCRFESAGSLCSDGLFCTVGETCNGSGSCAGATPRDCGDGISCTTDSCNEAGAQCLHTPSDAACSDGQFCNGVETCSTTLGCRSGAPVNCDDGDICTDDACNEAATRCDHVFDPTNDPSCVQTACGNGRVEPGEQCDDGNTASGDCCSSACQFESAGSPCGDGLFCTVGEACNGAGACSGATPRDCGDGIGCTTDSCDEAVGACVHTPSDAACSDGQFCNGVETCGATSGCQPGAPVNCSDGDICTDDSCDEAADACAHVFDPTNDPTCAALVCGNGSLDPGEQCDDGNKADGDCCASTCRFESAGSPCSDAQFCTVGETCNGSGSCGGSAARDCGDGISCTTDSCNEAGAQCLYIPNDPACSDGQFCNGVETCSAAQGCRPGAPVDCDDGDICTDDACDEAATGCDHVFDRTNAEECAARCPDADGDGYSATATGCGAVDCDDSDATVYPGASESCTDDKDNDCDGKIDAADETCGGAPKWSVRPGTLSNPAYAGSPACASCHKTQFDAWSKTLHARMLIRPGDAQAAGFGLPEAASLPGATVSIGSWSDVLFVVGQKWKTLYVDRDGNLQPLQWNYEKGLWSAHPGGDYDCGACHTTGYDPAASFINSGGDLVPGIAGAWVEYNIGCEACHGPGAEHAAAPSKANINRIVLDWTGTGDGIRTPSIRSAEVCGNCHYRTTRAPAIDPQRRDEGQFNDWGVSRHASTLEPTTLSTYCAKCHSPGNATADSEEHYFTYFEPAAATHVACVSCHDPHSASDARWADLAWPPQGRQDPKDHPAAVARYRGTDGNPATIDYSPIAPTATNDLCTDCHKTQPGFRRHVDAGPPTAVTLHPPENFGRPLEVPHAQHVADGVECVTCHMPYTRTSINPGDVRGHTLLPNEQGAGGTLHFNVTCGQCHEEATGCIWCHAEFGRAAVDGKEIRRQRPSSAGPPQPRAKWSRPTGR